MLNNYTFTIDFQVSILCSSSDSAMEMIISKHFVNDADVWNFSNTPADSVKITPTSETLELMSEMGEEWSWDDTW